MSHGVLLVHKPPGPTSHDVVGRVRKILKIKRAGHAGTLDPMASGLLVLLLGEGTKLSNFLLEGDKSYLATIQLGVTTDTLDVTGEIQKESDQIPPPEVIKNTLMGLEGDLELPVPVFSAVKVQGRRLYERARSGEALQDRPRRTMKFWGFEQVEIVGSVVQFYMHCTKGSFVRSLAAELGERLGCGGALKDLVRTGSAPYLLKRAVTVETLEELTAQGKNPFYEVSEAFVPLPEVLSHWPLLKVSGWEEKLLLNGQVAHALEQKLIHYYLPQMESSGAQGVRVLSRASGDLRALLTPKEPYGFKIQRIFPPAALDEGRLNL